MERCLVRQVANLQMKVDELKRGTAERDKRISELTEELNRAIQDSLAMRREIETLKEQAELDRGSIESLRSLASSSTSSQMSVQLASTPLELPGHRGVRKSALSK